MPKHIPLAIGLLIAATTFAAQAQQSPISGSTAVLAANCANCHGTDGRTIQAIPALAGLPRDVLLSSLKDYKEGRREATIMHQLSKGYTDDELAAIADYFSKQPR